MIIAKPWNFFWQSFYSLKQWGKICISNCNDYFPHYLSDKIKGKNASICFVLAWKLTNPSQIGIHSRGMSKLASSQMDPIAHVTPGRHCCTRRHLHWIRQVRCSAMHWLGNGFLSSSLKKAWTINAHLFLNTVATGISGCIVLVCTKEMT